MSIVAYKLTTKENLVRTLDEGAVMIKPLSYYRNNANGGVGDPTEAVQTISGPFEGAIPIGLSNNVLSDIAGNTPGGGKGVNWALGAGAKIATQFDAYIWSLSLEVTVDGLLSFSDQQRQPIYDSCFRVADLNAVVQTISRWDDRLKADAFRIDSIIYGPIEKAPNEAGFDPMERLFRKPVEKSGVRFDVQREIRAVFYAPGVPVPQELPDLKVPFARNRLRQYFEKVDIAELVEEARRRATLDPNGPVSVPPSDLASP